MIQAAIGEYDELLPMVKQQVLGWPYLKVFWFNKDNSTGHSELKKIKEVDRTSEVKTILKSGQGWTLPAENRTRWKGVIGMSSMVP